MSNEEIIELVTNNKDSLFISEKGLTNLDESSILDKEIFSSISNDKISYKIK